MAKQLNVNLAFSADTSKAKAQLQDLQHQLVNLMNSANTQKSNFVMTDEIQEATMAVAQLKTQLEAATNVDTGQLDLGKFSQSLKSTGMTLKNYQNILSSLGPAGDKAFATLAQSIMTAEVPLRRANTLISEMWVTLKNTARWQLSSSMLHGFMGAVQTAYGYAQNLNQSLNEIRIVTGASTDEMDKFAERANKAAKALSTSTTAYTDAALIFYQQGLSDEQVEERTNVTIKMAQVAGEDATEVSSYMTAIWNNFDDGSKSLEYYGDAMQALGAKTAASSAEIAEGLEKFAAIGDTIGLSFEYATSAVATVVDKTRQSADTVGTAFRTIFARLQGLQFGETLEDGVDLNKYSTALQKVGIEVLDLNGNLKDADIIINELGATWDTLTRAQQTALAQTVAGTRQYAQLISLMDNFDAFQSNVATATESTGTLDIGASRYAQSWEAAEKRVRAAAEGIYKSLLNDEFFIDMNNTLADFLGVVDKIIDGMGGVKGILLLVGSLATNVFRDQINKSFENMSYNIQMLSKTGREKIKALRTEANQRLIQNTVDDGTIQGATLGDAYKDLGKLQDAYLKSAQKMSEEQKQISQTLLDQQKIMIEQVRLAGEQVTKSEEELALVERKNLASFTTVNEDGTEGTTKHIQGQEAETLKIMQQEYGEIIKQASRYREALEQIGKVHINSKNLEKQKKNLSKWAEQLIDSGIDIEKVFGKDADAAFKKFVKSLDKTDISAEDLEKTLDKLFSSVDANPAGYDDAEALTEIFKELGMTAEEAEKRVSRLTIAAENLGKSEQTLAQKSSMLSSYTQEVATKMQEMQQTHSLGDHFLAVASSIGSVISILNVLKGTWETLSSSETTFGEKVMAVMTGLTMVIPTVIALLNAENVALIANSLQWAVNAGKKIADVVSMGILNIAIAAESAGLSANTVTILANTAAWMSNPIGWIAAVIIGVVAAVTLLTIGIMKLTEWLIKGEKIGTENCDTLIENAEKTKELADANYELSDSMEELIQEYNELNRAGENTADVLDNITEKMPELIKSYRELSQQTNLGLEDDIDELERLGNLGNLTGDYEPFTEKKKEIDNEVAKDVAQETFDGAQAAGKKLAAAMQDTNAKASGTALSTHMGGFESGGIRGDETKVVDHINNMLDDKYVKEIADNKHSITVGVDNFYDPTQVVEYYEQLVQARNAILNDKSITEEMRNQSGTFAELNQLIDGTVDQYEAAKASLDAYKETAGRGIMAEMDAQASSVDTMSEYLAYQEKFIKVATTKYKMTEDQAKAYLKEVEGLESLSSKYELASQAAEKFGNIEDFEKMNKTGKEEYLKYFDALTKDLSDEDLAIALNVIADADSIEEFENQVLQLSARAETRKYEQMGSDLSKMMADSQEDGAFSKSNIQSLKGNEDFQSYLKESGESFEEFAAADFDEQYNTIAQFYAKVQALRHDSVQYQKELSYQELARNQEILDDMYDMTEEEQKKSLQMKEEYAKKQAELNKEGLSETEKEKIQNELDTMEENYEKEFGWSIDLDTTDVKNKMQQIEDSIKELDKQQIQIAIEWDGIKEIEDGYERVGDFAKLMKKDAKQIGNSYQLTAAQAREWMEIYPDLFSQAKLTSEGMISLDQAVVDNYIDGQEDTVDATADAKIKQLEAERTTMEAKLKMAEADLEAAYNNYKGQEELANVSAEYLSNQRKNLTQYYIDLGMDEVNADAAALRTMGLNEEEYTDLVAKAAEKNANNQIDAAEEGGKAQTSALSKLAEKWKKFTTVLKQVGNAVKAALTGGDVKEAWGAVGDDFDIDDAEFKGEDLSGYTFEELDEQQITAAREKINSDLTATLEANKEEIQRAIDSIDSQIVYLKGLKNQDLADYGDDGSGKDKDKSKDLADLKEMSERYHEITREIKMLEHELDRLEESKDRAFGKEKIAIMDEEIATLEQLAKKQQELADAQKLYLILDRAAVSQHFSNATFDKNGNISNYTQLLQAATDELNAAEKAYEASAQEDADKKALEKAQDAFEKKTKVLEQYEETLDAWMEQQAVVQDTLNQVQDATYDKLTYKLELGIDVNEREMAEAEYYLNKLSEDFYAMAEAGEYLKKNIGKTGEALGIYENHYNDLNDKYATATISQDQYIEGLKETYDGIMSNLEGLNDLDKEMLHYYEDTLSMASEETDYYISQMEHLSSVLDHYRNIVELVNGEYDYEAIGTILEGQAKTRENEMAVAAAEYEMLLSEKKAIEEQMASVEVGSAAWDLYNEELQAITEATIEAEEEMLSKTEAWAESMKSIMENTFASAAYEMEMMMTQGLGFDALSNSLDKLSTFQEEYLTSTNEIFELEKMMRTAQQAADKTNNEAAKIKLKNYQNEIETLKNDGLPLSQLELNIQKAKYELLLAEIALEEAQNAKSTVRLQRDSEGNFGYVYTADTEAISSAEQDLADAQNNLYNIGLEGTNDYGQKLLELQNQLSDDLIALEEERAAGRFKTDEEYYAAKNDLITHYNNLFTAYSNQYTTALGVDNRIQEDAWINAYQNMIVKTENWKDYTKEYTQECEDAYDEWRENAVDNNELIQDVLDDTEDEVKEVTKASDNLKKKVVDEVIPAVESELIAVRNITSAYAKQRAEIKRTVSQYEKLITTIREAIAAQAALAGESSIGYNEKGQVTDYSWAMADYLANKGGAYGDAHWERLVSERNKKLETDEYSKYADGADDFEEMMEKYYKYKTQGVDNELTKYVEDVIANKQYWDQNKVENLIDEFATGGYTGAWGPEGRLAVVHEKELMLNQEDTVNFLQGIGLLREIAQMIDLEAMRNQLGALPYLPIANMQGAGGLLEQSVHIEANFPGVSDRYEIEEAFNNILNTATQYANRKI